MDILFENKYKRDKEWAKDIYGYILFRRPFMRVAQVFGVFYTILAIADIAIFHSDSPVWVTVALMFILLEGWMAFNYFFSIRMALKRDLEAHGKEVEVTVSVTEEQVNMATSNGTEIRLLYGDVKKAVQTKKYVYLLSKTNTLYSFKKDSFSIGNADDFLLFLKNRSIKVK